MPSQALTHGSLMYTQSVVVPPDGQVAPYVLASLVLVLSAVVEDQSQSKRPDEPLLRANG